MLEASAIPGFAVPGRMVPGSAGGHPVWVGDGELPSKRETAGHKSRRAFYAEFVAGRNLLEPLDVVQEYLLSLPSRRASVCGDLGNPVRSGRVLDGNHKPRDPAFSGASDFSGV
jgi:hypothetical protein